MVCLQEPSIPETLMPRGPWPRSLSTLKAGDSDAPGAGGMKVSVGGIEGFSGGYEGFSGGY